MVLRPGSIFRRALLTSFLFGVVGVQSGSPAFAQSAPDDATLKLGQRTFMLCQSCHNADKDAGNKLGPNLWGVFGRKAGTEDDYKYSDALKDSGITWSEKTLDQWLSGPNKLVPGTRMAFRGVDNDASRAALIAYLKLRTSASQ